MSIIVRRVSRLCSGVCVLFLLLVVGMPAGAQDLGNRVPDGKAIIVNNRNSVGLTLETARLVGEWRLVSYTSPDSAGQQAAVWGPNPIGLLVYTANGTMAAQLYDPRRGNFGVLPQAASPELVKAAFMGGISYYGTFKVDTAAQTVTHHVEGGNIPDSIGDDRVRAYRFIGKDLLSLTVLNFVGAKVAHGAVLVWERVRR